MYFMSSKFVPSALAILKHVHTSIVLPISEFCTSQITYVYLLTGYVTVLLNLPVVYEIP